MWDTRAGTVELAIPELRRGSYLPYGLLERHRRAEQTLILVVATAYLLGVSTRRVGWLAEPLGVTQLNKSHVSVSRHLDEQLATFRRPLEPTACPRSSPSSPKPTPRSRRLNGKFERSHRIDAEDFHRLFDGVIIDDAEVFNDKLREWEDCYASCRMPRLRSDRSTSVTHRQCPIKANQIQAPISADSYAGCTRSFAPSR